MKLPPSMVSVSGVKLSILASNVDSYVKGSSPEFPILIGVEAEPPGIQ